MAQRSQKPFPKSSRQQNPARSVLAAQTHIEAASTLFGEASFATRDAEIARRLANLSRAAALAAEPLEKLVRDLVRTSGGDL